MANTIPFIQFTREQLQTLAASLPEGDPGVLKVNPLSTQLALAQNRIYLAYRSGEILTETAPQATLPQQIQAISIDGVRYTNTLSWRQAWRSAYQQNLQQGLQAQPWQFRTANLVTARGQALSAAVTLVQAVTEPTTASAANTGVLYVQGSQGTQGVQGPQGARGQDGRGVAAIGLDPDRNLIITYTDGTEFNTGSVTIPPPQFEINSVENLQPGAEPYVTVTDQGQGVFGLSFGLVPGAPAQSPVTETGSYVNPSWIVSLAGSKVTGAVLTTESYTDPSWLTLTAAKVGLGNVTNESKATMFNNPTFTGTVTGLGLFNADFTYNFGNTPVVNAVFTITDSRADLTKSVTVQPSPSTANSALGGDELEMDTFICAAMITAPSTITVYVTALPGPVIGRRNFTYRIT